MRDMISRSTVTALVVALVVCVGLAPGRAEAQGRPSLLAAAESAAAPAPPTAYRVIGVDLTPFTGQRVVIVGTLLTPAAVTPVANQSPAPPELRPQLILPLSRGCL